MLDKYSNIRPLPMNDQVCTFDPILNSSPLPTFSPYDQDPTVELDPKFQLEIQNILKKLKNPLRLIHSITYLGKIWFHLDHLFMN